jgi:hypothetical protein
MAIDQKSGFVGLVTNAGRLVAPPGSLEVADNVVIRKPGVVEPRPGVTDLTLGWSPPTSNVQKLWEYDGKPHAYTSAGFFQIYSSTERQLVNTAGSTIDPALFRNDLLPIAQARGNCYVGTQKGVLKLTGSTDTAFEESGVQPALSPVLSASAAGSPTAVATGYKVAYRLVVKRTDANGIVTRSAPSGALTYSNTSGATRNVLVLAVMSSTYAGSFLLTSDEIEVYRTRAFTTATTIDEEFAYVGLTNTTTGLMDALTDAQRGAALYTSPSQGGATSENQRPPACGCMETYKGHLFFGNTVTPFRKTVSANVSLVDLAGTATGVGYRRISGTATISTSTITLMANTTGLQAGMIVSMYNGGTNIFAQNTYIVSVDSASQVTISAPAISTYTGNADFVDAVQVGGQWKPVFTSDSTGVYTTLSPMESGIGAYASATSASSASTTYFARSITPPTPPYAYTFVIEEMVRSSQTASTATIKATHGDEYSPALALYAATATDMDRDVFKHGLAWSKRDEPEHAPPLNYAQVGDKKASLLGLASTRDSLFILKEDGIWRLSGPGGNGLNAWRIDPFDTTTFCVLPQSIQKLNNRIYFLSNKGVARLSESGVEVVSRPINDEVKRVIYAAQSQQTTYGFYGLAGDPVLETPPYWASAANETENEYLLTIATADTLSGTLVYNELTNAWTTWSLATSGGYSFGYSFPYAMAWSPSERSVLIGTANTYGWVRKFTVTGTESFITGYDSRSDGELAVTISTVTGSANSYTVTYSAAKLLRVGDVVVDSAQLAYVVTSVTSSTIVVVTSRVNGTTYTAPSTGAGYVAAAATATVRARPFVVPSMAHKLWSHIKAGFAELRGATSLHITSLSNSGSASNNATAQVSELVSVPYYHGMTASYRGNDFKMNVPREQARSRDLWAGVEIKTALGNWQLDNFSTASVVDAPNKPPITQSGAA